MGRAGRAAGPRNLRFLRFFLRVHISWSPGSTLSPRPLPAPHPPWSLYNRSMWYQIIMGRVENGGKGSSSRAARRKNARNAENNRKHRLRVAAARGDRAAGVDETRAASGGSRGAAPGGDGAGDSDGDSDGDGEFADGEGNSRRPPREAPTGRDRTAGAGRPRGMSGTLYRGAPGGGGPGGDSSSDDDDDSRRVRRRATPASPPLPDMQGRRWPHRPPTPPPDAARTRQADELRAEREATVRGARAAVTNTEHLALFVNFVLFFIPGLFQFKMYSVFGLKNLPKSLIVPAVSLRYSASKSA